MENIKYAMENGFELNVKELIDGAVQVSWGTVQHVEIITKEEAVELELIKVEKTEEELMLEWELSGETTFVASDLPKVEKKEKTKRSGKYGDLTEKEAMVFESMLSHTYEYGLPVDTFLIEDDTNLKGRSVSAIIGSLYKKGYVEKYEVDCYQVRGTDFGGVDLNEYMVTEEAYDKFKGYV